MWLSLQFDLRYQAPGYREELTPDSVFVYLSFVQLALALFGMREPVALDRVHMFDDSNVRLVVGSRAVMTPRIVTHPVFTEDYSGFSAITRI